MLEEISQETIDTLAKAYADGTVPLRKGITVSTSLQTYDLEAPAKTLYPVLTPVRNLMPRLPMQGNAINWKAITAIAATGAAEPSVAEGARNVEVAYTEVDKSAAAKTFGFDDSVTWEAEVQGKGFEDLRARSTLSTLQLTMIGEEDLDLGGNNNTTGIALGTPGTITTSASGTGGTLPAATYDVSVVALPYFGWRQVSALTLPARHSISAAVVTQAITSGQHLFASVPVVAGAVAYAWFIGASGASKLERITTINSLEFSTALAGTGAAIAGASADTSTNALNYDGMLTQTFKNGYVVSQATGTAGTGTVLTTDSAGGVTEINTDLKYFWDNFRTSPEEILVNSQEAQNITAKVLAGGANAAYRIEYLKDGQGNMMGGTMVASYLNKFTGTIVKITIHPTMPPGTIHYVTRSLPGWYKNNEVPKLWVMRLVADYFEEVYARVTRKWEHGVYVRGCLQCYMPGVQGIRNNIANG